MGKEVAYLASHHSGPHAGWVVLHLVGRRDEMCVCLYHYGRTCLSFHFAVPRLLKKICVCMAELIAGATSAA